MLSYPILHLHTRIIISRLKKSLDPFLDLTFDRSLRLRATPLRSLHFNLGARDLGQSNLKTTHHKTRAFTSKEVVKKAKDFPDLGAFPDGE